MEKSKVYTRKGDEGYTSLVGGKRVPKTNPRIEAYGTIDELNAFIACLLDEINNRDDREFLIRIQQNLFIIGAYLAMEGETISQLSQEEVDLLEDEMDRIDELMPRQNCFILPGGSKSNSLAHVCRTICRRAERRIYSVLAESAIDPVILKYMNRLSDFFFLFSRKENFIHQIDEIIWEKP